MCIIQPQKGLKVSFIFILLTLHCFTFVFVLFCFVLFCFVCFAFAFFCLFACFVGALVMLGKAPYKFC